MSSKRHFAFGRHSVWRRYVQGVRWRVFNEFKFRDGGQKNARSFHEDSRRRRVGHRSDRCGGDPGDGRRLLRRRLGWIPRRLLRRWRLGRRRLVWAPRLAWASSVLRPAPSSPRSTKTRAIMRPRRTAGSAVRSMTSGAASSAARWSTSANKRNAKPGIQDAGWVRPSPAFSLVRRLPRASAAGPSFPASREGDRLGPEPVRQKSHRLRRQPRAGQRLRGSARRGRLRAVHQWPRRRGALRRRLKLCAKALGVKVTAIAGDIGEPGVRAALLAACPAPDILVNNNGGPPPKPFSDCRARTFCAGWRATC